MANNKYEQELVDKYWDSIKSNTVVLNNNNCKAKKYSDLEYIDNETKIAQEHVEQWLKTEKNIAKSEIARLNLFIV